MTEYNQSAEAMPGIRTITRSVDLCAEGRTLQIAFLELSVPGMLPNHCIHKLELESASLMRTVASLVESSLFGEDPERSGTEGRRWHDPPGVPGGRGAALHQKS